MIDLELSMRLDRARPFLREQCDQIDPLLPKFRSILLEVRASKCWHTHGNLFEHPMDVYKILKLWNAPDPIDRCGLFHSIYSNSYVNLAIFQPNVVRQKVKDLIGDEAEELDNLLFRFSDEELIFALKESTKTMQRI
ncbi:hypothetical protein SUGI_0809800 [Cryptomeria japonica]|nr:hypothetical protein SUGI_0809800 [Cryptomeria japonica]